MLDPGSSWAAASINWLHSAICKCNWKLPPHERSADKCNRVWHLI